MNERNANKLNASEWIAKAHEELTFWFGENGLVCPENVVVRVGHTSKGIWKRKGSAVRLGEAWPEINGVFNISLHAALADDTFKLIGVLAHELCHTTAPKGASHGQAFVDVMVAIGMDCDLANAGSCSTGDRFNEWSAEFITKFGEYPEPAFNPGYKKQTTRLLKLECPKCGFIARASKSAVLGMGYPAHCGRVMVCEQLDEEQEDAED